MLRPFEFNEKVALEAVLYIANKSQNPDFIHIAKLLYFADKEHLAEYGRFICGDSYIAMPDGPVPSRVYDMLKAVRDGCADSAFPNIGGAFEVHDKYNVVARREPDLEWLSDSDIECLDASIRDFDKYDYGGLSKKSHDSAWRSSHSKAEMSIEAIVQAIGNPPGLLEHLKNQNP